MGNQDTLRLFVFPEQQGGLRVSLPGPEDFVIESFIPGQSLLESVWSRKQTHQGISCYS